MKYIAAYALLVLGGNEKPTEADVTKVLQEVGVEVNAEDAQRVVNALKGKPLHEIIAAGTGKLANISFGSGGGSAPAPAAQSKGAEPAKAEVKKEEPKKEEEPEVGLGGGLFGDDEEW